MEPKREREQPTYSGLTQAQQKRANENRILFAKSGLSLVARGLWLTLFTRQRNTEQGCFPSTEWLRELAPGRNKGNLYAAIEELESLFLIERKPGRGKRRTTYHVLQPHLWPAATVEWLRKSAEELEAAVESKQTLRNEKRRKNSGEAEPSGGVVSE